VGNYGVQVAWKDGHDTGIYTWEMLRTLFETKRLSQQTLKEIKQRVAGNA
jgi:DUF971 family protein